MTYEVWTIHKDNYVDTAPTLPKAKAIIRKYGEPCYILHLINAASNEIIHYTPRRKR